MLQITELWCLPCSTNSRWYRAARVGSIFAGEVGGEVEVQAQARVSFHKSAPVTDPSRTKQTGHNAPYEQTHQPVVDPTTDLRCHTPAVVLPPESATSTTYVPGDLAAHHS
jgi:hypothetical protein